MDNPYQLVEQFFNQEIYSRSFSIAVFFFILSILHIIYKATIEYFLVWDPIAINNENDKIRDRQRKSLLITTLVNHNYLHLIFWYWLTDIGQIFPTTFEMYGYLVVFSY